MKKVPAIYDPVNGLLLGESHAIIAYLMKKYKLE
jgi:glutathione S-transferase